MLFARPLPSLRAFGHGCVGRVALCRGRFASAAAAASLIDVSRVRSHKATDGGLAVFAAEQIRKGELVERGVVRRLKVDGGACGAVHTWGQDRSTWAISSGNASLYGAPVGVAANTEMKRFFDADRFEIFALRDIQAGEELCYVYEGMEWRDCYADLRAQQASGTPRNRQVPPGSVPVLDSSKLYAKLDQFGGVGAFAARPIKMGDLVEHGVMNRVPVDGNENPFVFTWSEDRTIWAAGSGISMFFNSAVDGSENTTMKRFFDEDRFEIYAKRDIETDEELTHLYKSMQWRKIFKDLRDAKNSNGK